MKKWIFFAAGFAALGLLARLPHPARDISMLDPVGLVYVYEEAGILHIETDTGAHGSGMTLSEAAGDMQARADREIFLETAEYLLLDPDAVIGEDFFALLRPGARVFYTAERPDLSAAARYLTLHEPDLTLSGLRSGQPEG